MISNNLRDLLDDRPLSLRHKKNDRRCRLHNWSAHHSVALPGTESEASSLCTVELGLLELVCMITVSSTRFSLECTCGIYAALASRPRGHCSCEALFPRASKPGLRKSSESGCLATAAIVLRGLALPSRSLGS